MEQNRTLQLKWEFPEFPPRPIIREVVFSLMNYKGGLYFVNESDDILKTVSSDSFGFILDSAIEDNPKFIYTDVKPGEGVKVEEYDNYYDLDYVLGFKIYIELNDIERIIITPPAKKGGVIAQPLIYKDGTTPRYVRVERLSNKQNNVQNFIKIK